MTCLNNIVINGNAAQTKFRFNGSFESKRAEFLDKYKSSSGKAQYKRCVNSTLRYAGGKSLAVGILVYWYIGNKASIHNSKRFIIFKSCKSI
ncbi:MAG: hypothetical protein LE169_03590 [Endomicrobium sp.]|nr:hypothetical protein [Endomicrobium sp.]